MLTANRLSLADQRNPLTPNRLSLADQKIYWHQIGWV